MRRITRRPVRNAEAVTTLRFENATDDVYEMMDDMRQMYFPDIQDAKIKCLFDMKKRKQGGNLVLGRLQKSNDLIRRLTVEETRDDEGYDYVLFIDKKAWEVIPEIDKQRLIRHELRHADVFPDKKHPYCLKDHDVQDFSEEIRLNQDDVSWAQRVATLVADVYDQESDDNEE